jgi:hypothetical protein
MSVAFFEYPIMYKGYLEINLRWAVKNNKKEGKIFYYIQKLVTYVDYFWTYSPSELKPLS